MSGFLTAVLTDFGEVSGEQAAANAAGQGLLSCRFKVTVNIGGHLNVSVTEVFLHIFQGEALVNQKAGAAVAQFVKTDMGQAVLFQQQFKMAGHIVRGKWMTIRPLEYIAVVLVRFAVQFTVAGFILFQL